MDPNEIMDDPDESGLDYEPTWIELTEDDRSDWARDEAALASIDDVNLDEAEED